MADTWKRDPTSRRTTPRPVGWKARYRAPTLQRDGHRCTWIATQPDGGHPLAPGAATHPDRCPTRATDVDHIGAPDDHRAESLRSLCGPHHDHRTGQQAAAAAAAARATRPRKRPPERHPGLTA